jgi:DNA-binding MltR family transcriptional regulator
MSKRTLLPAEALSADTQKLFDVLNNEPDFSVIVVSCAYVDACLGSILAKYLLESSISSKLLDVRSGALGSFAARSDVCYSLGLISKNIYQDLLVLGELRNQVAHHHHMLDFSATEIAEACRSLKYAETLERWDMNNGELMFRPGQLAEPRVRFVMTVVLLAQRLLLIALGTKRVTGMA